MWAGCSVWRPFQCPPGSGLRIVRVVRSPCGCSFMDKALSSSSELDQTERRSCVRSIGGRHMDENQRAEFARLEVARAKYCTNCNGPSPTAGLCPTCMTNLSERSPFVLPFAAESTVCVRCGSLAAICTCATDAEGPGGTIYAQKLSADTTEPTDSHDVGAYSEAYQGNFSASDELNRLWSEAARDGRSFDAARTVFWGLVNQGEDADSAFVRAMLEAAGFRLGHGTDAPMLSMDWDDERSGRLNAARRLSIDHATPQSRDPSLATDPDNLRFMLQDDNSRRGARWTSDDRRYNEVCPGCWVPSPGGIRCQTCVSAEGQPEYLPDR